MSYDNALGNVFLIAQQLSAGLLLCLAVIHAALGMKHQRRAENWLFALTAFLAAMEAVAAQWRFTARSVPEMVLAMKVSFGHRREIYRRPWPSSRLRR